MQSDRKKTIVVISFLACFIFGVLAEAWRKAAADAVRVYCMRFSFLSGSQFIHGFHFNAPAVEMCRFIGFDSATGRCDLDGAETCGSFVGERRTRAADLWAAKSRSAPLRRATSPRAAHTQARAGRPSFPVSTPLGALRFLLGHVRLLCPLLPHWSHSVMARVSLLVGMRASLGGKGVGGSSATKKIAARARPRRRPHTARHA